MKLQKFPDYGELMTLDEFITACETFCFVDYDGCGKFATDKEMSYINVSPSDVLNNVYIFEKSYNGTVYISYGIEFTHVIWFNR